MKISIITPTLNRKHYLKDVLNSVLGQSYKDIEYIIVDGLSNDGSLDLIKEYEKKFVSCGKVLRYVSEKDNGLYEAMNKGIKMASGDVVGVLNSDDFFNDETCVERIVKAFNDDNELMATYADSYYVNKDNIFKPIRCYSQKHFKISCLLYGYIPDHETFYAKKECYERFGYINPNYSICGDVELILRLMYINNIKAKYIPYVLITNRIGGASTRGGIKTYIKRIKEMMDIFDSHKIKTYRYRLILRYIYRIWNKIYIPKRFYDSVKRAEKFLNNK